MQRIRAAFVLGILAFGGGQSAHAGDGALEINQACAVNTGCFPGDTPGFPVTITSPGSYRLTSNLQVQLPASQGILTGVDNVRIDLANFEIAGPETCSGTGAARICTGAGQGVSITRGAVSNGVVRNFAVGVIGSGQFLGITAVDNRVGIQTGDALVADSVAQGSGEQGFYGQGNVTYRNCVAQDNGGNGFLAGGGSVWLGVRSRRNGAAGIWIAVKGVVRDSVVESNGAEGINAVSAVPASEQGAVIESNTVSQNGTDGIVVGPGSLVARNVVRANGAAGISALSSSSIQGNVATANGVYGLYLIPENGGTAAAYRDNFVTGSPNSVAGGINMGGNSCNGTTTCP